VLDNFKPATPKRPNSPRAPSVSDEDVLASFGSANSDQIAPEQLPKPVASADDSQEPAKFRVKTSAPNNKKRTFILIGIVVFVIAALAAGYWWTHKKQTTTSTSQAAVVVAKKIEKPKIYSPLTGVEVTSQDLANRPVTGVMIENSPDARPQSALDQAGIVFEAIAEGGITRFLALFQEDQPNYIGPVRSARPYYVEWAKTFDAGYAHVGGSPDALALIKTLGVKDLDQFANGNSYTRVTSRDAPHNVYTDFIKLDALNTSKGYTSSKFTPWERKADVKQTPTASIIDLSVSGPAYSPRFTYDATTNSYLRLQEGEPHYVLAKDLTTKKQINPKTVIVLVTNYGLDNDGYHSSYKTTGSGNMYVFQDGIVSIGKWSKADTKTQFVFTDKNGLSMKLNRGQTWVTLVSSDSAVSYKP
jgi:hypothetical protein